MKLIKPSFTIIEQESGLEGMYKQIELAGRTCYKSEDKITETSAKDFVDRMIKSGHGAMLEHGTVYLYMKFNSKEAYFDDELALKYHNEPHTKVIRVRDVQTEPRGKQHVYITTNYRVLVENNWLDDLKYLCEPTEYKKKRVTVKFTTDQGILREFTRHRTFSFAVESTRYCNYSKNKFNNEVTFIEPDWIDDDTPINSLAYNNAYEVFYSAMEEAESYYMILLESGFKPQQARNVLPLATKCDMVMTGFISDWEHFFHLRTPANAHPQARQLAIPLLETFKSKNYLK